MSDNIGRIFGIIAALAALWILVYWWWEPARPRITFDPTTPAAAGAATVKAPPPAPPVEPVVKPAPSRPETPPKVAVIPPRFREYTLKQGDTFESIAQRELGDRKHAAALRSANPLMDPERLKAGRTIQIPLDPTNIQGKPVAVEAPPAAPPSPAPSGSPQEAAREYTVKPGDTLSGIAKAQYGSTRYKDLIYEANKDRLASEDDLKQGDKLRLPPKPK